MSTKTFGLREPFTSLRTEVGGEHTRLSMWVNHANAGHITLRNNEVDPVVAALSRGVAVEVLIWSTERAGYWLQSRHGYTQDINIAGLFTLEDAVRECNAGNLFPNKPPNDMIVPVNPVWLTHPSPATPATPDAPALPESH